MPGHCGNESQAVEGAARTREAQAGAGNGGGPEGPCGLREAMRRLCALLCGVLLLDGGHADPARGLFTRRHIGTFGLVSNPERGFRDELHPNPLTGEYSPHAMENMRRFNLTVGQTYFYIPTEQGDCHAHGCGCTPSSRGCHVNETLSPTVLAAVGKALQIQRNAGVKAKWRFAYDRCDSGPIGENNYTAATILSHMKQLKAAFNAEIDAVYAMANGFIGCWGEWHGARMMPDVFGSIRKDVQAIFEYELSEFLPADRKVSVRVPAFKVDVALERADCPETVPAGIECPGDGTAPLPSPLMEFGVATQANFKSNTAVARIGFDNDYVICDQTGGGTWVGSAWNDRDIPKTSPHPISTSFASPIYDSEHGPMTDPGYAYARLESAFVPMDGEMGWGEGKAPQPRSYKVTTRRSGEPPRMAAPTWPKVTRTAEDWSPTAETAAWRFREMHYTTLSLRHGYSGEDGIDKKTGKQTNHNETIDRWMQTPLNLSRIYADRLPISPVYALGRPSGYEYLRDHLGYRLELRSTTMPRLLTVRAGTASVQLSFAAALINWGFAAPISPRPVQLVLMTGGNSTSSKILWRSHSLADPREWQPYVVGDPTFAPSVHRFRADNLTVPTANLTSGAVLEVGLFLPDMRMKKAVAAGVGAAYSIRLANADTAWVDVPGEGGVNVIGELTIAT